MDIVPFKHKYLFQLREILESRDKLVMYESEMRTLPRIGYIVLLNKQPIAVGFLRRVEPCFAQIDTLASNSYFGSQIRHEGIKLVVDALIVDAKRLKLKGIISFTKEDSIIQRAKIMGFHETDQKLIAIALT